MEIKTPPIKLGDNLYHAITGWGTNGDPMIKINGYIIFLKNIENKKLEIGVPLKAIITKVFPKFAIANLIEEDLK